MAKTTIIGDYGKLARASETVVSTGSLLDGVKYAVTALDDTSSTLPAGLEVGYVFVSDGTEDITATDDEVIKIVEVDQCDVQSWSADFSRAEIDATTLCDDNNVYLSGKTDITGSMEGIYKVGTTDADGGIANAFVTIVEQADDGGAVTLNKIDNSGWLMLLYLQADKSVGETEVFYVAPATITSWSSSIANGSTSSFSSSFRIAPDSDIKFQLVKVIR